MSELVKVYSPDGEVFENSPANARDLVVHAGWSYDKLKKTATAIPAPVEAVEEVKVEAPAPEVIEVEAPVEVAAEEVVEEAAAEEVVAEDEADEDAKPAATRGRKKKS